MPAILITPRLDGRGRVETEIAVGDHRPEARVGLVEGELHGGVVHHVYRLEGRDISQSRRGGGFVHNAIKLELDRVSVEVGTVRELHALLQMERDLQIIRADVPGFGQPGMRLAILVHVHQPFHDEGGEDAFGVTGCGLGIVQRLGIQRQAERQGITALRRRGGGHFHLLGDLLSDNLRHHLRGALDLNDAGHLDLRGDLCGGQRGGRGSAGRQQHRQ